MEGAERHVGSLAVDTALLLVLDPTNLVDDDERERVFRAALEHGSGPVWLSDPPGGLLGPPEGDTADAVAIEIHSDGTFPVFVTHDADGRAVAIRIDLRPPRADVG